MGKSGAQQAQDENEHQAETGQKKSKIERLREKIKKKKENSALIRTENNEQAPEVVSLDCWDILKTC